MKAFRVEGASGYFAVHWKGSAEVVEGVPEYRGMAEVLLGKAS